MNITVRAGVELIRGRRRRDQGASLVEYALLAALIAVVCILAVAFLGDSVSTSFDSSGRSLNAESG